MITTDNDRQLNNDSASEQDSKISFPVSKILDLLEHHLGDTSEIVYHDLTKPYEHTIADIRNGGITGRQVGGCGSNLGLEVIRGTVKNGDKFNYITHTKGGRILRSSTIYLRNEAQVVGAICINTDISDSMRLESFIHQYNGYTLQSDSGPRVDEHFAQNVSEILETFIQDAQALVGTMAPLMSREERLKFLEYLDSKGAFLISKSSEHVCDFLGISKYTLYNYLETIRSNPR